MREQIPPPEGNRSGSRGESFRSMIGRDGWYDGAGDQQRRRNSRYDIEAGFDGRLGLPTQLGVSADQTFPIRYAHRWWTIDEPFRKVLGHLVEHGCDRSIFAITEFIIHGRMMTLLRGGASGAEIAECHEMIREAYSPGRRGAVRGQAKIDRRLADLNRRVPWMTFAARFSRRDCGLHANVTVEMLGRAAQAEDRFSCRAGRSHPNRRLYTGRYGSSTELPIPISCAGVLSSSGSSPDHLEQPAADLFEDIWHLGSHDNG